MKTHKMSCGCEFEVNENGGLKIREHIFNQNCPATYKLIQDGNTVGCFQIESKLLRSWCKKLKPETLQDMCDLVAIVRPGTLKSIVTKIDDKPVTAAELYIKVKNKEIPVSYYHPCLEPILKKTRGIILYQEQILKIASLVAGFDLRQADILRRGIGKKKADIVAQCRKMFVDGAEKVGLMSKEEADKLFDMIEASNRYSFNVAHSYTYGVTAYESAYLKAHFPLQFYQASLEFAADEQDPYEEFRRIVQDARVNKVEVCPPNINDQKDKFYIKNNKIYFGLTNIRGISENTTKKIKEAIKQSEEILNKKISEFSWFQTLVNLYYHGVKESLFEKLILAGVFQYDESRKYMVFELKKFASLSDKEQYWLYYHQDRYSSLVQALQEGVKTTGEGRMCFNKNRLNIVDGIIKIIKNPPTDLEDSYQHVSQVENELLGISLTCHPTQSADLSKVDITCEEITSGKRFYYATLGVEILEVKEFVCKSGEKMAFLSVEDESGSLDTVTAFPAQWNEYKHILQTGNLCLIGGNADKTKKGLIIDYVEQI